LAYSQVEPFGPMHVELLAGILARQITNTSISRPTPPAEAKDFMPSYREPELTPHQIKTRLRSLASSHNAP